jgi:hypothetical protein
VVQANNTVVELDGVAAATELRKLNIERLKTEITETTRAGNHAEKEKQELWEQYKQDRRRRAEPDPTSVNIWPCPVVDTHGLADDIDWPVHARCDSHQPQPIRPQLGDIVEGLDEPLSVCTEGNHPQMEFLEPRMDWPAELLEPLLTQEPLSPDGSNQQHLSPGGTASPTPVFEKELLFAKFGAKPPEPEEPGFECAAPASVALIAYYESQIEDLNQVIAHKDNQIRSLKLECAEQPIETTLLAELHQEKTAHRLEAEQHAELRDAHAMIHDKGVLAVEEERRARLDAEMLSDGAVADLILQKHETRKLQKLLDETLLEQNTLGAQGEQDLTHLNDKYKRAKALLSQRHWRGAGNAVLAFFRNNSRASKMKMFQNWKAVLLRSGSSDLQKNKRDHLLWQNQLQNHNSRDQNPADIRDRQEVLLLMKAQISQDIEAFQMEELQSLAAMCTHALARAHVQMGTVAQRMADQASNEALSLAGRQCTVCLDNLSDILLEPCRHVCVCSQCVREQNIQCCPICRETIHNTKEVYHA